MSEAHGPDWDTDYDLYYDIETYCEVPIRNGTHAYAAAAEIMMAQWAVGDDGPIHVEDLTLTGGEPSEELLAHLRNPRCRVIIHKSDFDRTVTRHAWGLTIDVRRVWDTMVQAMAHSLPGGLEKLSAMYRLGELSKHKDGKAMIQLFCSPMPKNSKIRRATPQTHPEKWAQFLSYGGGDIASMRELKRKLPTWNYSGRELELWRLDQRINDRGFQADVRLAEGAVTAVKKEQARLKKAIQKATGYDELIGDEGVESATKRDQLLGYILQEYGVTLPDMKKDTLERRLADPELPSAVKELIRIRLAATTSSTAKYGAALRAVSRDGRMRGTLQFAGALRTARWSGRLFQPQNMMRPDMSNEEIEMAIRAFYAGSADLYCDDVMKAAANAMRGMIIAGPGKSLFSSDLKNIEGRMASWLSGEKWKLKAYADYDDKIGPDLYVMAYARAFGVTPEQVIANYKAGGFWRQVGKVMELALAYEGGVGAWLAFAAVYRLDLEAMAKAAYPNLPVEAREQAEKILAWRKKKGYTTFGLTDVAFVVIEAFKTLWREAHPETTSYWGELNRAAIEAVRKPGKRIQCRRITFVKTGVWLRMILPSGRSLCYPSPQIKEDGKRTSLSYMGVNQYTRKWQRIHTYGGKLFENACQAVARDVMAHNMIEIEEAGFEIVLTVHDDVIAEGVVETGSNRVLTSEYLSALLAENPPWLRNCPLSADGFEAQRYRKD